MPPSLSWPTITLNIPPLFRPSLGPATSCFSSSTHLPFPALLPPASQSAFFPGSLYSFLFVVSHVWHLRSTAHYRDSCVACRRLRHDDDSTTQHRSGLQVPAQIHRRGRWSRRH